ncbi:MAG TPA: DUF1453 domain-containing protein [Thermoanaerobaculia bacterium]|nr:DUF1453 domain-containing protein [Thermoanaerobaculia bacterium]
MPLLVAVVAIAVALFALLALFLVGVPLSMVRRYRAGTARRLARSWIATVNLVTLAVSVALFLVSAAVTGLWVPRALPYTVAGLAGGCLLGLLGLAATRWEATPEALHYTPNRWLVLSLTLVVAGHLSYSVWRGWHAWRATPDDTSWLAAAGIGGSLAAGAVVLGYYLSFWAGVRWRLRRHRRRSPLA